MKPSRLPTTIVPNKLFNSFRRRALIALLLLATVIATLAIPSGSAGKPKTAGLKALDIELRRQNTPVWCWAATIAMVVQYLKNRNLEDCQVLSMYDRSLGGRGMCCQGAYECLRTGQTSEMANILGRIFDVHGRYIPRPLSFDEVRANINDDKPMIAGLQRGQSGHVVVIAGYDTSDGTIKVLDPMHGEHWVPYNVLTASWQMGIWNLSFEFTTERDTGRSDPDEPRYQTITEECTHVAHPQGDLGPCSHGPLHPNGDFGPCQHVCYDYYGRAFPCHRGDVYQCQHPRHPNGDLYPCTHLLHPSGHQRRVRIN